MDLPNPDAYAAFIAGKAAIAPSFGISDQIDLPPAIKPFQGDIVRWALRRGRAAIFANAGLGKTVMQLSWADALAAHSGGRILILTPLAVAQQTVEEATKFGIEGVAYARDKGAAKTEIVVTNYDRVEKFDLGSFAGIVLDESSILKAHDSKTRAALTDACQIIPYRLACTATPAPNDWVELGNHAEFLGVTTQKEMLATYFVHDGSIRAGGADGAEGGWRLKRHAQTDFWQWVASWAAMARHPRDLGYEDAGYDLPPLVYHQVTVPVEYAPTNGALFPMEARTLSERLGARRDSIESRAAKAAEIIAADPDKPWLIWCNLNAEADAMKAAVPRAVEVRGSDDPETKAERLLGFAHGKVDILLSKPSLAGFGMNFQRCSDMIFLGLSDSFEQIFQAVRRCWRFGQSRPVNVYMVASELEGAVVANLQRKERQHEEMGAAMAAFMKDFTRANLRGIRVPAAKHTIKMEIPAWLGR
jgi:hypothetical protein